jgi:hypothetical protein
VPEKFESLKSLGGILICPGALSVPPSPTDWP